MSKPSGAAAPLSIHSFAKKQNAGGTPVLSSSQPSAAALAAATIAAAKAAAAGKASAPTTAAAASPALQAHSSPTRSVPSAPVHAAAAATSTATPVATAQSQLKSSAATSTTTTTAQHYAIVQNRSNSIITPSAATPAVPSSTPPLRSSINAIVQSPPLVAVASPTTTGAISQPRMSPPLVPARPTSGATAAALTAVALSSPPTPATQQQQRLSTTTAPSLVLSPPMLASASTTTNSQHRTSITTPIATVPTTPSQTRTSVTSPPSVASAQSRPLSGTTPNNNNNNNNSNASAASTISFSPLLPVPLNTSSGHSTRGNQTPIAAMSLKSFQAMTDQDVAKQQALADEEAQDKQTEIAQSLEEKLKRAAHRQLIVSEILSSERSYVAVLQQLYTLYVIPLRSSQSNSGGKGSMNLTPEQINSLCSNIETIYKMNSQFVDELELAVIAQQQPTSSSAAPIAATSTTATRSSLTTPTLSASKPVTPPAAGASSPPSAPISARTSLTHSNSNAHAVTTPTAAAATASHITTISALFLNYSAIFKIYSVYTNQYEQCLSVLNSERSNKKLQAFLAAFRAQQHQDVTSYLVSVVQRLPRYVLLIKELRRYTPYSHPEYAPLRDALSRVEAVALHVNELKRQSECMSKLCEIVNRIQSTDNVDLDSLLAPHRRYIQEQQLLCIHSDTSQGSSFFGSLRPKKRLLILFNDWLLLVDESDNMKCKGRIELVSSKLKRVNAQQLTLETATQSLIIQPLETPSSASSGANDTASLDQWSTILSTLIESLQLERQRARQRRVRQSRGVGGGTYNAKDAMHALLVEKLQIVQSDAAERSAIERSTTQASSGPSSNQLSVQQQQQTESDDNDAFLDQKIDALQATIQQYKRPSPLQPILASPSVLSHHESSPHSTPRAATGVQIQKKNGETVSLTANGTYKPKQVARRDPRVQSP